MAITLDGTTGISSVDGSNASPSVRGSDSNSGIVYAADTVKISTGGTERLEVDSSGNIDIPDSGKIRLGGSGDLTLTHDGSNSYLQDTGAGALYIDGSSVRFRNYSNSETMAQFIGDGQCELYYNNSAKFKTQSAGLEWYGSGNGNGEVTYINDVAGDNKHSEYRYERTSRSTNLCSLVYIGENGASQGEVMVYGSAANSNISGGVRVVDGATSWSAISDMRLKDKTGDITNALTDIAKIEPIKFTWKADSNKKPQVGVSAQSVENVVPEAVAKSKDPVFEKNGDETEYLSVKYTELIPLCIAAIKEAKTKIETLETEVKTLKTKVAALEAG